MRHSYHVKNSSCTFTIEKQDDNKFKIYNNLNNYNNNNNIELSINNENTFNEEKKKIIEKLNEKIQKSKITETISPKNQKAINLKSFENTKKNQTFNTKTQDTKSQSEKKENENENEKSKENQIKNQINKTQSPNKKILEFEKEKELEFITENQKEKKIKPQIIEDKLYGKYFKNLSKDNIQIPIEYLDTIYNNLLLEENEGIFPKPEYNYMKKQTEINEQMRSILVDWIIDIHFKFGFTDETLFMTILIIDRYLSIKKITRSKLQLLGITALMISCKHEEIDLPKTDDFIYITDNAYLKDEVFKMENDILNLFKFNLLFPSPIKFYEMLSFNFNFNKKQFYMGKYLMETFLIDIKNIKYKASVISCACVYIVMKFFKMNNYHDSYDKKWYLINEKCNNVIEYSVKECAKDICLLVDNIHKSNYLSTQKKYSKSEFEKVALLILGK